MGATVKQASDGLVAALQAIGVRAYSRPADITAAPCAFVLLEAVDYQNAFALGDPQMDFTVTAVASRTSDRNAYDRLSAAVSATGSSSIRAAIEADRTLGGVCQTLLVERADNIRMISQGDQSYLAVDFSVRIHA